MKKYDVALIGAGISSLTAGILLARKGYKVGVFEKIKKPGGYLHCFRRFGASFDSGAHYVGAVEKRQPFRVLLEYLDCWDEDLFVPLDSEGFDHFHFPDFEVRIPKGYDAFTKELTKKFPKEENGIQNFLNEVQETTQHFQTYNFSENIDTGALLRAMDTPLKAVVDKHFATPDIKRVITAHCCLHGVQPEDVSFGMHSIILDSFLCGSSGFKKGGGFLAQKMVEKLEEHGGELHLKCGIREIKVEAGQAVSLSSENGEHILCDTVISGIHPQSTLELINDSSVFRPAFRARIENLKESVGMFGCYVKMKSSGKRQLLKNEFYFSSRGTNDLEPTESSKAPPRVVFRSASERCPEPGKTDSFNLLCACPYEWVREWSHSEIRKRPEGYETFKEAFAQKVFDVVEIYDPGFRDDIDSYVCSTPLSNKHYNMSPEGSAYGIYHSIANTGARAIGPRTRIPNLLLTGQNTLFPGILGAAISGLRSAGHILGIKPMIRELKNLRDQE